MGRKNLLDKSLSKIECFFDSQTLKSFNYTKLRDIVNDNRSDWGISSTRPLKNILNYLIKKEVLFSNTIITSTNEQEQIYSWKTKDDLTIMSGLKNDLYFSFYTAIYLHGLTLQIPKIFYLNHERSFNPITTTKINNLSQDKIDNAFSKPQRKSKIVYRYNEKKIILTNGKYTERLGVYSINILNKNENKFYNTTDLERTLIDISVRPVYSGGVFEVLQAYKLAKSRVDVLLLKEYLEELDYIYPYHQVIGFYLEKAGYSKSDCQIFSIPMKFKFYLTYEIRKREFDKKWNIYYPKGM